MVNGDDVATLELLQEWFDEDRHWIKGELGLRDKNGEVARTCLIGGLRYARCGVLDYVNESSLEPEIHVLPMINQLIKIITEQFPERSTAGHYTVPDFNDHPDTDIEDIRLVVGKALVQAREEAGL